MSSWRGTFEIIRFNWPSYLSAFVICIGSLVWMGQSETGRTPAALLLVMTLYFSLASLLASHWVYDRSLLADWAWLPAWLSRPVGRWLLIQAGFDATHGRLVNLLPPGGHPVVDLYGLPGIGGASVERARKEQLKNPGATVSTLPVEESTCDTILAIFCLHEIQRPESRLEFFRSLTRQLRPGGQLLVVEHLRDWKNGLVFGPGFLHFLPEKEWRRCADAAGLSLDKSRSITPFVRLFLWRKP